MKLGMFTSGYQRNDIEHIFVDAKRFGYDYIELWGGRPHAYAPDLKAGDINEAYFLLNSVGITNPAPQADTEKKWGKIEYKDNMPGNKVEEYDLDSNFDMIKGMGAKEATYLLQKHHRKVKLENFGTVQDYIIEGDTVILKLGEDKKPDNKKDNGKKADNKNKNNKNNNNKKTK